MFNVPLTVTSPIVPEAESFKVTVTPAGTKTSPIVFPFKSITALFLSNFTMSPDVVFCWNLYSPSSSFRK